MFDKDLFLLLCEKYNVELSESADRPLIKVGSEVHAVTAEDVNRIFTPCQTYFDYSGNRLNREVVFPEFYIEENFAIAC